MRTCLWVTTVWLYNHHTITILLCKNNVFLCRRTLQETVAQLTAEHEAQIASMNASYATQLAAAEANRQFVVTSFVEETAAEREQLLQRMADEVEHAGETAQYLCD